MKPILSWIRGGIAMAPVLALLALLGCGGGDDSKKLNIYIWTNYITQEIVDDFSAKTGIQVRFVEYDSNEAVLEKLRAGVNDFDIVVPTDYMVSVLAKQKLLAELDHSKLPNLSNLSPAFRNRSYDPANAHSIPYLWGTTGFAYNKEKVGEALDSWKALFDEKWKGRILMLDDMRECFSAALRVNGHSANSTNPPELAAARDLLIKQKPLVKTYNSSDFAGILRSGDVWIAQGYNGELAKACEKDKNLVYVVPKEGCTIWIDNLCIPKSSRHQEAAHQFINYMLDGKNIAAVVNNMSYACANDAAKPFINPQILNDPARYPDDATLKRCDYLGDLGDSVELRDLYWTEIKAK